MAEVETKHEELLAAVEAPLLPGEKAAYWWLGQHTFIVKTASQVIYFDPWLAADPNRQTQSPLQPHEAKFATLALVSHGHTDHLDPITLREMIEVSPLSLFVCPHTERQRLLDEARIPAERLHSMDAEDTLELNGVKITAVKAKHEAYDRHPVLGYPYLGYVVETDGITIYHAGDTILWDGMISKLQQWKHIDLAFIPINGRDAERFRRNCMGNLTYQEAVEVAGELQVGLVVPAHYDMFIGNQEDPTKFVQYLEARYPTVRHQVGPAGRRISLR